MTTRKERKEERRVNRRTRMEGRKRIMRIASDVYKPGDDAESLGEKIEDRLRDDFGEESSNFFLFIALLRALLPLLIRILTT